MVRTAIREGRKEMGKFPWMKIIHHYWAAIIPRSDSTGPTGALAVSVPRKGQRKVTKKCRGIYMGRGKR